MRRFLCVLLLMVLIPYVTTLAVSGRESDGWHFEEAEGDGPFVAVERNGRVTNVDAEEFLIGVVAGQIPADYGSETLKAQAVLARTHVYRELDGASSIPEEALDIDCLSRAQMEKLWGEDMFSKNYQAIREALSETAGETLFYGGTWITPFFCRAAAGQTRSGGEEFPYLKAAVSPGDLEADGFLSQTTWTAAELARRLNEIPDGGAVQAEALPEEIQIAERDSSGYVTSLQICGNLYTGEEVQYALGLVSPCFSFEDLGGKIRVSCKGIGAGYGFSQAGANALEREGYDYKELLHYYFQDVEILDKDKNPV